MNFTEYLTEHNPDLKYNLESNCLRGFVCNEVDTFVAWKQFQIESQYLIEQLNTLINEIGSNVDSLANWVTHIENFQIEFFSNFENRVHCICYDTNIKSTNLDELLMQIEENFEMVFDNDETTSKIVIDKRELLMDKFINQKEVTTIYVIKY